MIPQPPQCLGMHDEAALLMLLYLIVLLLVLTVAAIVSDLILRYWTQRGQPRRRREDRL